MAGKEDNNAKAVLAKLDAQLADLQKEETRLTAEHESLLAEDTSLTEKLKARAAQCDDEIGKTLMEHNIPALNLERSNISTANDLIGVSITDINCAGPTDDCLAGHHCLSYSVHQDLGEDPREVQQPVASSGNPRKHGQEWRERGFPHAPQELCIGDLRRSGA